MDRDIMDRDHIGGGGVGTKRDSGRSLSSTSCSMYDFPLFPLPKIYIKISGPSFPLQSIIRQSVDLPKYVYENSGLFPPLCSDSFPFLSFFQLSFFSFLSFLLGTINSCPTMFDPTTIDSTCTVQSRQQ